MSSVADLLWWQVSLYFKKYLLKKVKTWLNLLEFQKYLMQYLKHFSSKFFIHLPPLLSLLSTFVIKLTNLFLPLTSWANIWILSKRKSSHFSPNNDYFYNKLNYVFHSNYEFIFFQMSYIFCYLHCSILQSYLKFTLTKNCK